MRERSVRGPEQRRLRNCGCRNLSSPITSSCCDCHIGSPRSVEHRQSKYLNNRAENSHQPTRQRERATKRFTSARSVERLCPPSAASPGTSNSAVTASAPRSTAVRWPLDSLPGTRSLARPRPPDPGLGDRPGPIQPCLHCQTVRTSRCR